MGSDSESESQARSANALLLVGVAAVALFAGCIGEDGEAKGEPETASGVLNDAAPAAEPVLANDGRDLRTELRAKDTVEPPRWRVGEAWDISVLLDNGETLDYTAVMVEERDEAFFLASPDRQAAKEEAVWDLPIFGEVRKSDLALAAFGETWDWIYRFPLEDGATWVADVPSTGDEGVTFAATYAAAISTPAGDRPGFHIRGVTAEGGTLLDYDYVPELGWFAHFWAYDLETEAPDDFEFHAMVVAHAVGWTGDYYVHEARALIGMDAFVAVDPDDTPPATYVEPKPYETFTVDAEADFLYGFAYAWAFAGASELVLVDPAGQTYRHTAVGTPEGEAGEFYDVAATPGEWRVVQAGVGPATGGGVHLWELHEEVGEL